jgi:hypothetical protein
MKKLPFLFLLLFYFAANSQYYYKDIVAAADITRLMKTYTANNIKKLQPKASHRRAVPLRSLVKWVK